MKRGLPIILFACALLAACSGSEEQAYADGLILRDRFGCAFAARAGAGAAMFLKFNRQESAPTCTYPRK